VNKLIGTQPKCDENRIGKEKVGTVQVAFDGMVKEKQVTYSSLCQFGDKTPVPEVRSGLFKMSVAKGFQGVIAGLPGEEDPPGSLPGPVRSSRRSQFLFHW
jgi:hypothetical protein